jgi:hypothetical protein
MATSQGSISAEQWMNAWMNDAQLKGEHGTLYLSRFVEPMYFLLKPIEWYPAEDQRNYSSVSVPTGFVTDLASIPRVFWSLLRPDGEYTYPTIVHDYLYWTQTTDRKTADDISRFGMEDFHIDLLTVQAIYRAVRAGGEPSWKDNQKLRKTGERRVLERFPEDPRTRWADWKRQPGVFSD